MSKLGLSYKCWACTPWRVRKPQLDALDDGDGPYWDWEGLSEEDGEHGKALWADFLAWAKDNLGQGFSVACNDGSILDPMTQQAYLGFKAGRESISKEPAMGNEVLDIKTDAALLRELRAAQKPTNKDVRDQRVSFAMGALDEQNGMTREQVRKIVGR